MEEKFITAHQTLFVCFVFCFYFFGFGMVGEKMSRMTGNKRNIGAITNLGFPT